MAGTLTKRLISAIDEMIDLLDEENETHWVAWMRRASRELEAGDYQGVERLLSAYGGMGSFNDYVAREPANASRLERLRTEIHDLAIGIRRNQ